MTQSQPSETSCVSSSNITWWTTRWRSSSLIWPTRGGTRSLYSWGEWSCRYRIMELVRDLWEKCRAENYWIIWLVNDYPLLPSAQLNPQRVNPTHLSFYHIDHRCVQWSGSALMQCYSLSGSLGKRYYSAIPFCLWTKFCLLYMFEGFHILAILEPCTTLPWYI